MEEGRAFSHWFQEGYAASSPGKVVGPWLCFGYTWAGLGCSGLTGALCGREIIQSGGLGLAVGREGE